MHRVMWILRRLPELFGTVPIMLPTILPAACLAVAAVAAVAAAAATCAPITALATVAASRTAVAPGDSRAPIGPARLRLRLRLRVQPRLVDGRRPTRVSLHAPPRPHALGIHRPLRRRRRRGFLLLCGGEHQPDVW